MQSVPKTTWMLVNITLEPNHIMPIYLRLNAYDSRWHLQVSIFWIFPNYFILVYHAWRNILLNQLANFYKLMSGRIWKSLSFTSNGPADFKIRPHTHVINCATTKEDFQDPIWQPWVMLERSCSHVQSNEECLAQLYLYHWEFHAIPMDNLQGFLDSRSFLP